MIIIEGMDNTGKTTLLEKIREAFPELQYGKFDKVTTTDENTYRDYVWKTLEKDRLYTHRMIFDRFLFSELVYGPILRGKTRLTVNERMAALRLLRWHQPFVIYCHRDANQIMQTFDQREQLSGVAQNVHSILDLYNEWMSLWQGKFGGHLYVYDWEEEGELNNLLQLIHVYLN